MADVEKTVEIIFGAVDRTGRTIDRVGNQLDSVATTTQDLTGPLATATDSLLKVEAAILAVGTAAAAFAAKQAADFESGLTGIKKTTGIAGENLTQLGKSIQDLAVETGLSTQQLTELGESAGQLGVSGSDNILAFVETIGKMGEVSNISGDAAAKALARILELSGESADNIGQLGDVVVKLGNNLETSESEIVKMSQALARNVSQFEASSTQVAGFAGALSAIGARAEGAGTSVGRSFRAINKAINEGGEQFKELQRLTDMTGEQLRTTFAENAPKVFQEFIEGIGESTDSTAKELDRFGIATDETLKVLAPLASDTERLEKAMRLANEAVENGTALEREFAAVLDTTAQKAQRTAQAFNVAAQRVGAQYAEGTQDALDATTKLFDAFGDAAAGDNALADLLDFLNEQLEGFADQIEQVATELPEALEGVEVEGLIKSFRDLGGAVSDLFGGLDLTEAQDLEQAIQAVIDTIGTLTTITEGIVESFGPMVDALTAAGGGVNDLDKETKELLGNISGAAKQLNVLAGALQGVSGAVIAGGALLSGMASLKTLLTGIPGAATKAASALGTSGLLGTLTKLAPYLGIGAAAGASGAAGFALGRAIRDSVPYIEQYDKALARVTGHYEGIKEAEDNAAAAQERNAEKAKLLDELYQSMNVTADNFSRMVATWPDKLQDALDPTVEMNDVSDELRNKLREAFGEEPVDEFGQSVEETTAKVKDQKEAAEKAGDESKEAGKKGAEGQGLFRGKAEDVADQLRNGVVPAAEDAGEAGSEAGAEAAKGLSETEKRAADVQTKLLEIRTEFANKAIQARVELETANLEAATQRIQDAMDGVEGVVDSTGQTISELWSTYTELPEGRSGLGIQSQLREENQQRQESIDLIQEQARKAMDFAANVGQGEVAMDQVRAMTARAVDQFRAQGGMIPSLETVGQKAEGAAAGTEEIGRKAEESARGLQKTQEEAGAVDQMLSETAAKVYQAKVDLQTAQAEASARAFQSTMEGITASVESTGGVLQSLFGSYTDTQDPFKSMEIESAIHKEQKRRDKAMKLQEDLIEAQIDYYDARTERMQQGDAEISVSAEGLEPELEAFMWRIVERLHIRATQDEAEFLLGVNA